MVTRFWWHLGISFVMGIVIIILYYTINIFLSSGITLLLFSFIGIFVLLFYFRHRYTPNLSLFDFLEAYADGKISRYQKKNETQNKTPQNSFAVLMDNKTEINNELNVAKPNSILSKLNIGNLMKGKKQLFFEKIFSKNKIGKKIDNDKHSSVEMLAIPGPLLVGMDKDGISKKGDLAGIYQEIIKKNYPLALSLMKRVASKYTGKKIIQNDLGVLYYLNNLMDDALLEMEKAYLHPEKNSVICYNMALIYIRKKMFAEAMQKLQESIKLKDNAPAHYHLAAILSRSSRWDSAAKHLEQSKALGCDYSETIKNDIHFQAFVKNFTIEVKDL